MQKQPPTLPQADYTVLYAEDDQELLTNYTELLAFYFPTVLSASTGNQALRLYENHHPDFIICDINMPGINGLDLIQTIRETDKYIPIVILTAHSDKEKLLKATELGLTKYLMKPLNMKDLREIVQDVIEILNTRRFSPQLIKINENYFWDKKGLVLYTKDQSPIHVKGKEVTLINIFCSDNLNTTFSTQEIITMVWPEIEDKQKAIISLRTTLSVLKKKLGRPPLFESVYNVGYRLVR